ncbi:hypothetical protein BJF79_17145 [Actinomadura sp. CNU-125]|uniref:YciI family protein n=1 Tax=Actinomadura sp. CNU-125 TaxID=1904961 RepID=UPI0009629EE3|nr:YciI family protein [Actinomadura sp. CNU-125]OLT18509.1 hypothetical protein BJF79_17145 [Actinomadura sp. CNU-125]
MQYALLIHTEPATPDAPSDQADDAAFAAYTDLAEDPRYVSGAGLESADTATCVRVDGGRTLMTDGPFADTKEILGGICIIEAADLDEAIDFATRVLAARDGVIEIRPVSTR